MHQIENFSRKHKNDGVGPSQIIEKLIIGIRVKTRSQENPNTYF